MDKENMYFDTSSFDFDLLTDGVVVKTEEAPQPKSEVSVDADGGVVDDASDLISYSGDPEETNDEEESEEEGTEEGDVDEEGDGETTVTDEDGEEVDFEDYQISLPSGEEVTLSELVRGYRDNTALETAISDFNAKQEEFAAQSADVGRLLEIAKLEADRVIEDYRDFDWDAYREKDPAGYVENHEFLKRYKERREEIISAQKQIETQREENERISLEKQAREAGVILTRDIPGWGPDLYQKLMDFAIANGADKDEILKETNATTFKILHKAYQFDKGSQTVKAKVKKIGAAPVKVVKPGAKPESKQSSQTSAKKEALVNKMKTGGLSKKDNMSMFEFLVD